MASALERVAAFAFCPDALQAFKASTIPIPKRDKATFFLFLIFFFIISSFRLKLFSDLWEGLISFPAMRIQSEAEMKLKNFEEFVKIM